MTIKNYQYIATLDSGSTTFEYDIAKYFNVDTNQTIDKVREDTSKFLDGTEYELKDTIELNGKLWMYDKDLLDCTFEQWIRLETLLSEQDNLKVLHKLIAIFLRPSISVKSKWYTFPHRKQCIEPFDLNKQDGYSEELLELPIMIANSLMVFFYQSVPEFTNYIKIPYLNQVNQRKNSYTKKLSIKSGDISDGV